MSRPVSSTLWLPIAAAATMAALTSVSVAAGDDSAATSAPAAKAVLWSYQPVKSQATPEVQNKKWVRTPIDAFVLAKLEANKLEPSADADRATFIRRADRAAECRDLTVRARQRLLRRGELRVHTAKLRVGARELCCGG